MSKSSFSPASQYAKDEIARMYKELTDDDLIAENKRKHDRKQIIKDRIADTGL